MDKHIYTYKIHMEPEPEGGFTVTVPALPGCVTWGKDMAESLAMAQEAIGAFVESLVKEGESVPEEDAPRCPVDSIVQIELPAAV